MDTSDTATELLGMGGDVRLLLNGEWEFAEGPDGDPPTDGWERVRVPHRSREFEDDPPESGWYRTELCLPDGWDAAGRIVLDLGRVRHFGRAYLDGEVIGEHYGMRLPWRIDLTDSIRPGLDYRLDVFTHNCSGRYAHPDAPRLSEEAEKALDTRFWYTSAATVGMESDVWLSWESRVRVEDVQIVTSVREREIRVGLTVRNDAEEAFHGDIRLRVRRAGETELELAGCDLDLAPGESRRLETAAPWRDAVLWGRPRYGEPVLYFLESSLQSAGRAMHTAVTRFGFREIWAEEDRLLLNGIQLMPWGDHTVPYVYERQWLTRKFVDLADANVSIVEHHRYDPPPVFYDVADELGVFVVGANFCVGTGQVYTPEMDVREKALVREYQLAVADYWIRSVRNHPSILFWDITDARDPEYCVPLLRKVKELDDSRIAEVTFDPSVATDELIELIDCYRLFSGLENIEASIDEIRSGLPVKPIRVGEAGIFDGRLLGRAGGAAAGGRLVGIFDLNAGAQRPRATDVFPRRHGLPRLYRPRAGDVGWTARCEGHVAVAVGSGRPHRSFWRGDAGGVGQASAVSQLVRSAAAGLAPDGDDGLVSGVVPPARRAGCGAAGAGAIAGGAGASDARRATGRPRLCFGDSAGWTGGPALCRAGRSGGYVVVCVARSGCVPLYLSGASVDVESRCQPIRAPGGYDHVQLYLTVTLYLP